MNFAELVIDGLSDAGFRIVKTNPKLSIEQLKEKGLSPKDTEVLNAFVASIKPFEVKEQPLSSNIKSVRTTQNPQQPKKKSAAVLVHNKRTGMTVAMSPKAGNRVLGKLNPNRAGAVPKNLGIEQPDIRTYEAR